MGKGKKRRLQPQLDVSNLFERKLIPKLIWPCYEYNCNGAELKDSFRELDRECFPGMEKLSTSHLVFKSVCGTDDEPVSEGVSPGSQEFWDAFSQSESVVFADKFFSPSNYRRMIIELERKNSSKQGSDEMNIFIFCLKTISDLEKCHKEFKKKKQSIYERFSIKIGKLIDAGSIHIHDRFAIMDGEIWHCGAAVGGMHGSLNALSRGWLDKDNQLYEFFLQGEIVCA